MSENLTRPILALLLAASAGISWGLMRWLHRYNWPVAVKIMFSGLLPFAITVVTILFWDSVERAAYDARGLDEGFMGPGVFLIYGFPYLIAMVIADVLATIAALKQE